MKEKMYLTENMKEQIQNALEHTVKDLWIYGEFRNPLYPNFVMLESVILEMFTYPVARELLDIVDKHLAMYYRHYNKEGEKK